jgi:hypothetical protein
MRRGKRESLDAWVEPAPKARHSLHLSAWNFVEFEWLAVAPWRYHTNPDKDLVIEFAAAVDGMHQSANKAPLRKIDRRRRFWWRVLGGKRPFANRLMVKQPQSSNKMGIPVCKETYLCGK